mmetsp:Transcript_13156/g.21349  ORF Transcript_13156/g.21349 Transcript_13156/m.21349 type:complete len:306 (-) Transcript_13156:135-1052(-)|eukprot:CAMPEP_0203762162 /NCGR_PEP_ID=MMETSP0098-20131031/15105_1 /ASSEMBLY_ACC=CAM_ASM_000208 /TAXON_ID=96639 /ORGANISM=" , Strain NY0313808BC1" /LENGTH=305 /DNA_ID=CAMNT_0050656465 /DNA_START=95 /DNA_END=1012 /DNA_ORIENTATION=-
MNPENLDTCPEGEKGDAIGLQPIKPIGCGQGLFDEQVVLPGAVCGLGLPDKKSALRKECPHEIKELVKRLSLQDEYDKMIEVLIKENNKSKFSGWCPYKVQDCIGQFTEQFETKGVKLHVCAKPKPRSARYLVWIELVPVDECDSNYMSPNDIRRYTESCDSLKTVYTVLKFPQGVGVLKISGFRGRKKLRKSIPESIKTMMVEKQALEEYNKLIDELCQSSVTGRFGGWKTGEISNVVESCAPSFAAKGIRVYACRINEYVYNQYGGSQKPTRWLEFVDDAKAPNYTPARGEIGESEEKGCIIS